MTPTPAAAGSGFLAAIATVFRHENPELRIEFEDRMGLRLRVTIEGGDRKPLVLVGSPAALDARAPAEIEKYSRWLEETDTDVEITMPGEPATLTPKQWVQTRRKQLAGARKKSGPRARHKRKPAIRSTFLKPMHPDSTLAAVVGSAPLIRTEVTKKIWAYIKRNGLQDKKNRRTINADDKLRPLFGGKSHISMFEMTKLVARHLSAKPAPKKKAAPRRSPPAKRRQAPAPSAGKPGKAECIADLKALRARFGDELTRRGFIKQAKTGRRYEKLWKNWEEFTAEALGKGAAASKDKPTASAPPAATPRAKKPAKADTPAKKDEKRLWAVKANGKQIGATMFEKKPGDTLTFSTGAFVVQSIDTVKREIHVEPKAKASAPPPATPPAAEAQAPAAPAAAEQQPATTETT